MYMILTISILFYKLYVENTLELIWEYTDSLPA